MTNGKMFDFDLAKSYTGNLDWLVDRTIFLTVHGSTAYGTNTPSSDLDVKGVCIPPKGYFLGFSEVFEQAEQNKPDMVIYSLQKFMRLASQCNPNIIELLFTGPEFWLRMTPVGEKLYDNRHLFLSTKARHTFAGYAFAQLHRMKNHRTWLMNPPSKKPERSDFGLSEISKVSASVLGAFTALENQENVFIDKEIIPLLQKEKAYHNSLAQYKQYESWKIHRNPERAKMEAACGYDAKHGYHLVRLMRMCREILTTGQVIVKRPDAQELLEIRNGSWPYDKIISWAEGQEKEFDELYKACTILPKKPDLKKLQALCVELTESML